MQNKIHTGHFFLSCDWGTTSFRLKLAEKKSGKIVEGIESSNGIKKTNNHFSAQKNPQNRTDFFLSVLSKKISVLGDLVQHNLDNIPILISGMASSGIGLKELPYKTLPIDLRDPGLYIETFPSTGRFPHDLHLISGICTTDDVIRGEETQLLGLTVKLGIENGVYIFPGTHSKHIYVKDNVITDFRTFMTGELFELVVSQSILSDSVSKAGDGTISDAFKKGIEASLRENLLNSLFKIRGSCILRPKSENENYDFLSGLLIGTEMAGLLKPKPEKIILTGEDHLRNYYSAACKYLNLTYFEAGLTEDISSAGHRLILNNIKNQN